MLFVVACAVTYKPGIQGTESINSLVLINKLIVLVVHSTKFDSKQQNEPAIQVPALFTFLSLRRRS